jgi:hypothetical protein
MYRCFRTQVSKKTGSFNESIPKREDASGWMVVELFMLDFASPDCRPQAD